MSLFRITLIVLVAVAFSPGVGDAQVVSADSAAHVIVPLKRNGVLIENVFGNPRVAGAPYVLRIHNENNFFVLPHTHPEDENIVVLQGIWHLGSGPRFERSKLKPVRVGDFTRIPRRMPHFAWSEGATIIQVHGIGPFRVDFVDPAFSLSQAKKDTSAMRHFKFQVGDTVVFDGGRGVVRDGMASPANRIVQYLLETKGGEMVLEERVLRR